MKFEPFSIGRYHFEELLAKGGMGEIYLVKVTGSQGFQKQFAIKRLIKSGTTKGNAALAFEQEARLCSMLTHPNIAQVYDFVRAGKSSLLVMEYVNGRDLGQILRQLKIRDQKPPVPFAVFVVAEVAKGLEFAHTKKHPDTGKPLGIVHRDISPQNIMIAMDGHVKLVDFGVARIDMQPFKTATGFIKGKPKYMSPEQAKGEKVDLRTDLYGLGLVLVETLSGVPAFSGNSPLETFRKVQNGRWAEELLSYDLVPKRLELCIRRSLKLLPVDRQASAFELGSELEEFLRLEYPGYGERDVAAYLSELFHGVERTYDSHRDVEPFSLAELRCIERGGLEESGLTPDITEKSVSLNSKPGKLFPNELSWVIGLFVAALILSGSYLAFKFTRLKQSRQMTSIPESEQVK